MNRDAELDTNVIDFASFSKGPEAESKLLAAIRH